MTLRDREDRIFEKYRTRYQPLGQSIIPDGALGEEYPEAPTRLLVVLKEPNDEDGSFAKDGGDIRDFGKKYDRPATWNNLARWSALVQNPQLTFDEIDVDDLERRHAHLRRIAVVNLKKTPGKSHSRYSEIKAAATKDWDLLQEQMTLYEPHLTLTGNVIAILTSLLGKTETKDEGCFSYFHDPRLGVCFDFYHPQQRTYSNQQLFIWLKRQLIYHGFAGSVV